MQAHSLLSDVSDTEIITSSESNIIIIITIIIIIITIIIIIIIIIIITFKFFVHFLEAVPPNISYKWVSFKVNGQLWMS